MSKVAACRIFYQLPAICRKSVKAVLVSIIAVFLIYPTNIGYAKKSDRAAYFMHKVAQELLAAASKRSIASFERVINSYADIPRIAHYSLGNYSSKLPRSQRSKYYKGVAGFMARYFATQARAYKFDRARVFTPSYLQDGDTIVVTQVFLDDGASHRVLWRLSKRGKTYKIVDAKVMGFWLTPFQRTMFNNYIDQQGGNVRALVLALSY